MLTHDLLQFDGILVVKPEGPLTASDFEALAEEIDPYIANKGTLKGLLIEAPSFPGWENFGAFLSHFRFVRDHHRHIAKVAVVSDSTFLSLAPRFADHFVSAEVRHFGANDADAAMSWLQED